MLRCAVVLRCAMLWCSAVLRYFRLTALSPSLRLARLPCRSGSSRVMRLWRGTLARLSEQDSVFVSFDIDSIAGEVGGAAAKR